MEIINQKEINEKFKIYSAYETFFKCTMEEINNILEFMLFVSNEKEKMSKSKFVKSKFWEKLSSTRFVSISSEYLMIKSADRFQSSPFVTYHFDDRKYNNIKEKFRWLIKNIKVFITYFLKWNLENYNVGGELKRLEKIYGNIDKPENHNEFMKYYPERYVDHLEVAQLIKHDNKDIFLEIGSANCVNVALQTELRKLKKSYLIDLPEAIMFGYCYLNVFFKNKLKIALPHEVNDKNVNDFDIIFLLPTQTELIPDKSVDLSMNISSFQEMNLEVVQNYLDLLEKKLKKGGEFISVNQIEANYINNNKIENWNLSNFDVLKKDVKFVNSRNLTLDNLKWRQILLHCKLKNL